MTYMMQNKVPQATFNGQVKRGLDNWKNGRVDFYVDEVNGSWTVRFFHSVNPHHVVHQFKSLLGKSASIICKCGRLIIGDKKDGNELHIKFPAKDTASAQRLVKKICTPSVSTPTHNRAEVGLTTTPQSNGLSVSKGKGVNLTPVGLNTKPQGQGDGWLSKKTPPSSQRQDWPVQTSAKRKIQLDSVSENCNGSGSSNANGGGGRGDGHTRLGNADAFVWDDEEEDNEISFPHFTGMKDYSKRQRNMSDVNLPNGLGTTRFYGAQNTLMSDNAYRGLNWKSTSSSQQYSPKSPKVKRAKLSDLDDANRENKVLVSSTSKSLLKGALANRMSGKAPTLSDPQEVGGACGGAENDELGAIHADSSGHQSDGHTIGFDNLGNTCFMNSPLQCLSSLEPLSLDIQSAVSMFGPQLPSNSITKMLYLLMKDVRKLDVRPERVKELLTKLRHDINGKFEINTQQDAHELLNDLLDRTDEEVKALLSKTQSRSQRQHNTSALDSPSSLDSPSTSSKAGTESEGKDVKGAEAAAAEGEALAEASQSTPTEANFTWFYRNSFYFHECKTEVVSNQEGSDTTLMLALDSKTTNLQDCIDKYFERSEVDMRCEKCGKEEKATMTRKIVKRPRCFILTLLRYHTQNLETKKNLDHVTIPRYMSVVEFCAEDVKAAPAIPPVFMLDREKTLPGLDLIASECDDKPIQSKTNQTSSAVWEDRIDNIGMSMEKSDGFGPPLPDELLSHSLPHSPPASPNRFGSIGEGSARSREPIRQRKHGHSLFRPSAPVPSRRPPPLLRAPGAATPPSDDDKDDKDDDNQVVPTGVKLPPPTSCSSPKLKSGHKNRLYNPTAPIEDSNDDSLALGRREDHFSNDAVKTTNSSSSVMSPLTIDVNLPKLPPRLRDSSGERNLRSSENDYRQALRDAPPVQSVLSGLDLDERLWPYSGQEVEIPHDASGSLPSDSASTERDTDISIEAARVGKRVAMAMASNKTGGEREQKAGSNLSPTQARSREGETTRQGRDPIGATTSGKDFMEKEEGKMVTPGKEMKNDPEDIERATIKRLANYLADQFAEVEHHIEIARQANEDFTEIYIGAQTIILATNETVRDIMESQYQLEEGETRDSDAYRMEEQLTLSLALMRRALVREDSDEDFNFHKVMRKLIGLRYRSVHGRAAQLNHLVNDLAMFLAAKEVGVVVDQDSSGSQEIPAEKPVSVFRDGRGDTAVLDHSYKYGGSGEVERKGSSEEKGKGEECTSLSEDFMEEDSGNRGSLEVNPDAAANGSSSVGEAESEDWSTDSTFGRRAQAVAKSQTAGSVRRKNDHVDKSFEEQGSKRWKDSCAERLEGGEEEEESSSGALADVSSNATINTTKNHSDSVCDPGFLGGNRERSSSIAEEDLPFLGRPMSEWSEQELQALDISGLTDEDMMIYAQALSRIEYEREQISHSVSNSTAGTDYLDSYSYKEFLDSMDSNTTKGADKEKPRSDAGVEEKKSDLFFFGPPPGEVSSTSGSSLSETSDIEREEEKEEDPKKKSPVMEAVSFKSARCGSDVTADSVQATCSDEEGVSKTSDLDCEESLSDADEPDGTISDHNLGHSTKSLKGGNPSDHSSASSGGGSSSGLRKSGAVSGRVCPSCGQAAVKDKKLCPCWRDGPGSASNVDNASVLSPSKSSSCQTNALLPQSKVSPPSSSSSDERTDRSRHSTGGSQSPRQKPLSPAPVQAKFEKPSSNVGGRNAHMLLPSPSHLSPRKDSVSLSQSKSARNELARLRSPSSASPRKRTSKDSSSSSSVHRGKPSPKSASKRLSFDSENNSNSDSDQSSMRRVLASGDGCSSSGNSNGFGQTDQKTSLLPSNHLLDNYPMQMDLINGSLAKTADGEEADPDGIQRLLSSSFADEMDNTRNALASPFKSSSNMDVDEFSTVNKNDGIPIPVPISGSVYNSTTSNTKPDPSSAGAKSQLSQILLSSSPKEDANFKRTMRESAGDTLAVSCEVKENLPKREEYGDGHGDEAMSMSSKQKSSRPHVSFSDEKENQADSAARRERLQSIEMGKADSSYRLVGIVNHHGDSLYAGHYTAFSFNFNKQRWFMMDDKHTDQTSESRARVESTKSGYVFFYMDKDLFNQYAQAVLERSPKRENSTS